MNPFKAIASAYRNYGTFRGRATRAEFWWYAPFALASLVAFAFAGTLIFFDISLAGAIFLLVLVVLLIIVPLAAATVRRLHDADAPGWLVWVILLPWVGATVLLIAALLPGTHGPNSYGPDQRPPSAFGERDRRGPWATKTKVYVATAVAVAVVVAAVAVGTLPRGAPIPKGVGWAEPADYTYRVLYEVDGRREVVYVVKVRDHAVAGVLAPDESGSPDAAGLIGVDTAWTLAELEAKYFAIKADPEGYATISYDGATRAPKEIYLDAFGGSEERFFITDVLFEPQPRESRSPG